MLLLVLAFAATSSALPLHPPPPRPVAFGAASNVLVIGVDGLGGNFFDGEHPALDELIAQGAHTLTARGVMPTSSKPNWASIVMGAGPEEHGVESNDWAPPPAEPAVRPIGGGEWFPSMWAVAKAAGFATSSTTGWDGINDLHEPDAVDMEVIGDDATAIDTMEVWLREQRAQLNFVQVDELDGAGHGSGWGSPGYYEQLLVVDRQVRALLDALEAAGTRNDTVVIVVGDHGGSGTGHGGFTEDELFVPLIVAGPGICEGCVLDDSVRHMDAAATALFALGVEQPALWIARAAQLQM